MSTPSPALAPIRTAEEAFLSLDQKLTQQIENTQRIVEQLANQQRQQDYLHDTVITLQRAIEQGSSSHRERRPGTESQASPSPGVVQAAPAAIRLPLAAMKVPHPQQFDGSSQRTSRVWIDSVDDWFNAHGIVSADTKRPLIFPTLLINQAKQWWISQKEQWHAQSVQTPSWDEIRTAFLHFFHPVSTSRLALTQLDKLKQKGSVQQYANEFQRILLSTPVMEEQTKVHRFCSGLRDDIVRALATQLRDDNTLMQVMHLALATEAAFSLARGSSASSNYVFRPFRQSQSNSAPSNSNSSAAPMDLGQVEAESEASDTSEQAAAEQQLFAASGGQRSGGWRPNGRGVGRSSNSMPAWRRECLDKNLCFYCRQPGHTREQCPKRVQNAGGNKGQVK